MRHRSLAVLPLLAALAAPAQQSVVTEWTVPWPDTRPRDPSVGADGRVWFVGQVGNYVGVLNRRAAASDASNSRRAPCRTTW